MDEHAALRRKKERFLELAKRFIHFEALDFFDPGSISAEEVVEQLEKKTVSYFIGCYSEAAIRERLEHYGIMKLLAERGYPEIEVSLLLNDPYSQILKVFAAEGPRTFDNMLAEIVVHEGTIRPKRLCEGLDPSESFEVIVVEWMMLQNPRAKFTAERPRLPGQRYPGLGIGRAVVHLLERLAERLGKDGIINHPSYYHNAKIYKEKFRFVDPVMEGKLAAIARDLRGIPVGDATRLILSGCVIEKESGEPLRWRAEEQALPVSDRLRRYFESDAYRRIRDRAFETRSFSVDWDRFAAIPDKEIIE